MPAGGSSSGRTATADLTTMAHQAGYTEDQIKAEFEFKKIFDKVEAKPDTELMDLKKGEYGKIGSNVVKVVKTGNGKVTVQQIGPNFEPGWKLDVNEPQGTTVKRLTEDEIKQVSAIAPRRKQVSILDGLKPALGKYLEAERNYSGRG